MVKASDFYAVLGVDRTADDREIKKAYFRLVRKYSPETHPEEFKRVREAYEVLYREYVRLHDYFGRGENDVMKVLRGLRAQAKAPTSPVVPVPVPV